MATNKRFVDTMVFLVLAGFLVGCGGLENHAVVPTGANLRQRTMMPKTGDKNKADDNQGGHPM